MILRFDQGLRNSLAQTSSTTPIRVPVEAVCASREVPNVRDTFNRIATKISEERIDATSRKASSLHCPDNKGLELQHLWLTVGFKSDSPDMNLIMRLSASANQTWFRDVDFNCSTVFRPRIDDYARRRHNYETLYGRASVTISNSS